jgi:hypothetical protein
MDRGEQTKQLSFFLFFLHKEQYISKKERSKRKKTRMSIFFSIDPEWEALLSLWEREQLTCKKCGFFFYEIENIGSWKCYQHAVSSPRGGIWPCCGKSFFDRGCIRADHTTLPISFSENHDLKIPSPLKDAVGIFEKSKVEETSDEMEFQSTIKVRRFDWINANKLGRLDAIPATTTTILLDEKRWIPRAEWRKQHPY